MWNKPATLKQIAIVAGAVTLGSVTAAWQTSTQVSNARSETVEIVSEKTCLDRKHNIVESNRRWEIVRVKLKLTEDELQPFITPKCN